ncbi:Uncharacterised protein [Mycobacteroides abscessus subsp. abscessus]|nr:Uncharacterised protein [Mycobacteroides abscessus subsp. abscessus]
MAVLEDAFLLEQFIHFFNIKAFDRTGIDANLGSSCHHISKGDVGLLGSPVIQRTVSFKKLEIIFLEFLNPAKVFFEYIRRHIQNIGELVF